MTMLVRRFSRRDLIAAGFAGAAGSRLLPFVPHAARAADAAPPKRLLCVFKFGGYLESSYFPKIAADGSWTLGETMTALAPYKEHLIVPDGLEHRGVTWSYGFVNGKQLDNEHGLGMQSIFTGSRVSVETNYLSTGPSIDNVVADKLYADNPTKYRSLTLGVNCGANSGHYRCFMRAPGVTVTPEQSPRAVFDAIFKDLPLGGGMVDPAVLAAIERQKRERKSVIDAVRSELQSLCGRIGTAEKDKCDAHLTALRELERTLEANAAPPVPACTKPGEPVAGAGGVAGTLTNIHSHMDLITSAFACDLTRVAALQIGHGDGMDSIDGINHHNTTHAVGDRKGDAVNLENHRKLDRYYADRFAYLLGKLSSIREGNGTMLDNTLIMFGQDTTSRDTEPAVGAHYGERSPIFLAGGRSFAFKTGRALQLTTPVAKKWVPHNRLLVSIGRAFGLQIDKFGTLDPASGPMPML